MLKRFLFPVKPDGTFISVILLIVRVVFGVMLMNHGIDKWANYQELSAVFPDPLGIGSPLSLGLAIFGELACSMAFIIGFLYRLAMIPMIFTMCVAFFIVHADDPFAVKELAFVYLVVFVLMYIVGPGKFAVDRWISKSLFANRDRYGSFVLQSVIFYGFFVFFYKNGYICTNLKKAG